MDDAILRFVQNSFNGGMHPTEHVETAVVFSAVCALESASCYRITLHLAVPARCPSSCLATTIFSLLSVRVDQSSPEGSQNFDI